MEPLVRSAVLQGYRELAASLALDPIALMKAVGLDPTSTVDPDRRIPAKAVAALFELSASAAKADDFGLRLAQFRRFSNLGPVSLVAREEPDVRSALQLILRYLHLHNEALQLQLVEQAGLATIGIQFVFRDSMSLRQSAELVVGVVHQILRAFLGARWKAQRVCFAHDGAADSRAHRRFFGCPVDFGERFNGLVLRSRELDTPNPMSDPMLARYAHQYLETIAVPEQASVRDKVWQLIHVLMPAGRCSVEHVARSLGVDRRTVHRWLAASGTTFSALLNAARRDLAQRYVGRRDCALREVAALLGFSELSAFSRWYRAQFGRSPRARPDQGR
jgi:AraC-like DNA-binding protein